MPAKENDIEKTITKVKIHHHTNKLSPGYIDTNKHHHELYKMLEIPPMKTNEDIASLIFTFICYSQFLI